MKFLLFGFLILSTYIYQSESLSVEELTRRAQQLLQFASNEIRVLKEEGKALLAEGLEQEEIRLLELMVDLRAASASKSTDVNRLKERLDEFEDALGKQLKALGRDFVTQREKDEIIRRAQQILNSATQAVTHLREQNRSLEAEGLVEQEKVLIQLEVELRAAVDPNSIRRLETVLKGAETFVDNELRRLFRGLKKRDLQSDLILKVKELKTRAEGEVKSLTSENRTAAAELISLDLKNITALEVELQNATQEVQFKQLQQKVLQQENHLVQDLRRLVRPISNAELKDVLTKTAEEIIATANDQIKVLKQEGKTEAVALIESDERAIAQLLAKLKIASQTSELLEIERNLSLAEFKLYLNLSSIGRPVVNQKELKELIKKAEELAVRTTIEIRKLREQGKELLAAGLQREESYLIELDVELRTATDPEQIHSIEQRLVESEKRVQQELKQLGAKTK